MNNVKELLGFVFSLTEGVFKSLEDGKFDLTDMLHFVGAFKDLPSAVADITAIPDEIKNMTDEQKAELKQWVKDDFDIPLEGVEAAVESGLSIIIDLFSLWGKIKVAKLEVGE